jgi:hypothetical protein
MNDDYHIHEYDFITPAYWYYMGILNRVGRKFALFSVHNLSNWSGSYASGKIIPMIDLDSMEIYYIDLSDTIPPTSYQTPGIGVNVMDERFDYLAMGTSWGNQIYILDWEEWDDSLKSIKAFIPEGFGDRVIGGTAITRGWTYIGDYTFRRKDTWTSFQIDKDTESSKNVSILAKVDPYERKTTMELE